MLVGPSSCLFMMRVQPAMRRSGTLSLQSAQSSAAAEPGSPASVISTAKALRKSRMPSPKCSCRERVAHLDHSSHKVSPKSGRRIGCGRVHLKGGLDAGAVHLTTADHELIC